MGIGKCCCGPSDAEKRAEINKTDSENTGRTKDVHRQSIVMADPKRPRDFLAFLADDRYILDDTFPGNDAQHIEANSSGDALAGMSSGTIEVNEQGKTETSKPNVELTEITKDTVESNDQSSGI